MADFVANFGGCNPIRQPVSEIHRGLQTTREQLFSVGRRIYERPWRIINLVWAFASIGTVESVLDMHARSYGGVLTFDYTPDNGEGTYEIRFRGPMPVVQTGPSGYSTAVECEERIDQ